MEAAPAEGQQTRGRSPAHLGGSRGVGGGCSHLSVGQDINLIIFSTCSYSGCPGGSSPLGFSLPCWVCVPASLVAVFLLRVVWGAKRQAKREQFHWISFNSCNPSRIYFSPWMFNCFNNCISFLWLHIRLPQIQLLETAQMDLTGLTLRYKQGCVPFWNNPRRQSVSLPFASSRGCLHCLIYASFQLQNQ